MRISTNQIYDQNIRAIMENQKQLTNTNEQMTTGKRINRPSDDPIGAASVVRLTEQLDKITQFHRNNDLLTSALEQQETVLGNINDSLDRARTLAIQAGNSAMSDDDRSAIGNELEQIRNEVLDLMNSQDANGNYIYAGYQSQQQAFTFNPAAVGNAITFNGDSGSTSVRLSDSVTVQRSSSGMEVFENVLARNNFTVSAVSAPATLSSSKVTELGNFDQFFSANYDPVNPANNDYQLEVIAGNQVQLTNLGTGAVVDTVDFTSGEPFTVQGMTFKLNGALGNTVDFSLDPPEKKNIAETIHDLATLLLNGGLSNDALESAVADALVGLDNGKEALSFERSSLGGRMNIAESIYATNYDLEISTKATKSSIEDVDYAQASIEFSKQEAALSAALATFPQVTGLTLFDYIR